MEVSQKYNFLLFGGFAKKKLHDFQISWTTGRIIIQYDLLYFYLLISWHSFVSYHLQLVSIIW